MNQKKLQKNKPIISVRNSMAALFVVLITLMSTNIFAQTTDLVKFSFNGLSAYGPSPLTPSVTAANVIAVGLTRGSGLGTINTAAANAWGGTATNTAATQSTATSSNNVVTFSLSANTGYKLSLTQIPAYNIRRSGTGFSTGIWQYSINGGNFNDIGSSIIWGSITTSSGNAQSAITLSGISALQNVAAGNTITLRVVLWGASGTGSWYFNQPSAGVNDLIVTGTVALESAAPTPTCSANITASGPTTFCNGGNVTLTANSGSSYLWSNGATNQSISATTFGTYSVIVTNANSCSASTSITVTEAPPLVATITSNAPNTTICNGGTAVLSASISGGLGNINYQWQYQDNSGNWVNISGTGWSGTNVATPFTSSGRNASPSATRAYRIVVTSVANNQCSVIATQLVTVIADPVFTITSTNISCFGANNGTATAVLTGGLALNYDYNWYSNDGISTNNNPTGDGTLSVSELFPEEWVINTTVSGSNFGCYAEASVNITQPALLVASSISGSILCNGGSTNVTVSANGGTAPYTGIGIFNVSAGSYSYIVTDANGCSADTSINISEPTALVANSSASAILCNGGSAVVSVSANGGTAPYTGNGNYTVGAGSYNYIVTDANGCSAYTSIIVTEPTPLVATITSNAPNTTICNGGTAVLSASISGGLGNINYQWQYQDNSGNWVNISGTGWSGTNVATPFTSSGRNASPSATRAYRIVVTSVANNQCSVIATQLVTVIADPVFTITSTNISCFGANNGTATAVLTGGLALNYGYNWFSDDNISTNNNPTGDGTLSVNGLFPAQWVINTTVSGSNFGCYAQASVNITQPALLVASSISGSILCNGGSTNVTVSANGGTAPYSGIGIFNVSAGNYNYTVTDANGCSASTSATISEPTVLVASTTTSDFNGFGVSCNGGSNGTITVAADGGVAPYSATGDYSNLSEGIYNYTVTDANGCTAYTSGTISEPTQVTASSSATAIACNGGYSTVTVNASGGTAPYSGDGNYNVNAGNYSYTVIDGNGCTASTSVSISQPTTLNVDLGSDQIVYYGYTPLSCATIQSTVIGGVAPYTYNWSNGSQTNSITVCPNTSTNYTLTVTDANGCTFETNVTICVVDVVCFAGNSNIPKVQICHRGGTICVNLNAVAAHLAHGCKLGSCDELNACGPRMASDVEQHDEFIEVYPNPTEGILTINTHYENDEIIEIQVYNMIGEVVLNYTLMNGQNLIDLTNFSDGIYIIQHKEETYKVIKQ